MPRSSASIPTGSAAAPTRAPTAPRSGFDGHGGPDVAPQYPPNAWRALNPQSAPNARTVPAKAWRSPLAWSGQRKLALEDAEGRAARGLERGPDLRLAPPGALRPRCHVGRKRVADARAGHAQRDDRDVAGTVTRGPRRGGDREPRAHHVGIVDAAPQMLPLRHVTVLALDALTGEPARLPFVVGVLEQLAVQREPVGRELVTAAAELGLEEGGRASDPVVRQRLPWDAARERAVTPGRAEALVAPHVAAGARHALGAERAVVRGVGLQLVALSDQRRLLGERRVTRETAERRPRIALEHLHELTLEARARRRGMRALAPVGELRGVTSPARLGVERGLQRREARGRRALRRQRRTPVSPEKVLDRIGADGGGAEQHGPRRPARRAEAQLHRL